MAAFYTFEDYSGTSTPSTSENPYDGLIEACNNDPAQIQARYDTHRNARAVQQRAKLLDPAFPGVTIDSILLRREDSSIEPGFKDPRHCLVFWARPPQALKDLIVEIQRRVQVAAPNMWFMPAQNLHMTALEITHSLTDPEIRALVATLKPSLAAITDYTYTHRARLVKPTLSYDAQAIALSFVPAAGEALSEGRAADEDAYSYHHLRRDLYALASAAGVRVASRYVVPSAHLTLGRFIYASEFEMEGGGVDGDKVARFVSVVEEVNEWLKGYWPGEEGIREGGEWIVGQETGLDCRQGTLWYGDGEMVRVGKGF